MMTLAFDPATGVQVVPMIPLSMIEAAHVPATT